ncbi:MAG: hypothetical protein IKI57_03140 [Clostridia bacterium]|nr:hypothetical protein [Clostridia bacterium]
MMKKVVSIVLLIITIAILLGALLWFFFYETPVRETKMSTSSTVITEESVKARNSIYEEYFGEDLSDSDVRSLIVRLKIDNMSDEAKAFGEIKWVGIIETKELNSEKLYTIRALDYYENGSLKTVEIVEQ